MNYAGVRIKRYLRRAGRTSGESSGSSSRTNRLQGIGFDAANPVVLARGIGVGIQRMQVATADLEVLIFTSNLRMSPQVVAESDMTGDFR
jgi:hypothetical protein